MKLSFIAIAAIATLPAVALAQADSNRRDVPSTFAAGSGVTTATQTPVMEFFMPPGPTAVGPVAAVPEPGTYALLGAGLGAVGFIARRRRQRAAKRAA